MNTFCQLFLINRMFAQDTDIPATTTTDLSVPCSNIVSTLMKHGIQSYMANHFHNDQCDKISLIYNNLRKEYPLCYEQLVNNLEILDTTDYNENCTYQRHTTAYINTLKTSHNSMAYNYQNFAPLDIKCKEAIKTIIDKYEMADFMS